MANAQAYRTSVAPKMSLEHRDARIEMQTTYG